MDNYTQVFLDNKSTLQVNGDFQSFLFDASGGSTVNITGNLTISGRPDQDIFGHFSLGGPGYMATIGGRVDLEDNLTLLMVGGGSMANVGVLDNSGKVYVGSGATLNLTNQPDGITDIKAGSTFQIQGTFNNSIDPSKPISAFAHLETVEGTLTLENGHLTSILNSFTNNGSIFVNGGSMLSGGSDFENPGTITTGSDLTGGNKVNVGDELGNHGSFVLNGPGDTTEMAILSNDGKFVLNGANDMATIDVSAGNSGFIDLENSSTLTFMGDVSNTGSIYTSFYNSSGGNTLEIDGTLTNSPGAQFALLNPTDRLILKGSMNLSYGAALSTPRLNNGGTINVDGTSTLLVGLAALHGPSYNYTQLANGTLGEMIFSSSSYGAINVSGSALLGGTLDILLQNGFKPSLTDVFTIMTANSIKDEFSTVDSPTFSYNGLAYELMPFYLGNEVDLKVVLAPRFPSRPPCWCSSPGYWAWATACGAGCSNSLSAKGSVLRNFV